MEWWWSYGVVVDKNIKDSMRRMDYSIEVSSVSMVNTATRIAKITEEQKNERT